jgi:hypothetical protein
MGGLRAVENKRKTLRPSSLCPVTIRGELVVEPRLPMLLALQIAPHQLLGTSKYQHITNHKTFEHSDGTNYIYNYNIIILIILIN